MGKSLAIGIPVAGIVIALAVFQNQIRQAFFTAGQTIGQTITSTAEGFIEPFTKLKFPDFSSTPGLGAPSQGTAPLGVLPPPSLIPGETAPPPDKENTNPPPPGTPPPYYFPGFTGLPEGGGIFAAPGSTIIVNQPGTTTPPKQTAPPGETPPTTKADNKKGVGPIVVNTKTTSNYTQFLAEISKRFSTITNDVISAANQAWAQIQSGKQIVIIPGLPVITVPTPIPAFAEKPKTTKTNVTTNDKSVLGMGATSKKAVPTQPIQTNAGTFWNVQQIKVPESGKLSAQKLQALKKGPNLATIQAQLRGEVA